MAPFTAPFSRDHQLLDTLDPHIAGGSSSESKAPTTYLPGQPSISLANCDDVRQFLISELLASDLERVAPRLWLLSTPSSTNISPLHQQKVRGREIVVTEDPRLHLLWIHDRVFIKPLPPYLLSYIFWERFLPVTTSRSAESQHDLRKAAIGYLRTYRHLIRHESDFVIAQRDDLRLVPKDVSWAQFCAFASDLAGIHDSDVSRRYGYGELRLSRLNFYAPFLFRRFYYEQVFWQYSEYFARLFGPILLVFALLSIALSSMQVALAVEEVQEGNWEVFWSVCRWFSTITLVGTALICLAFFLLWFGLILDEWIYAIKHQIRGRKS